MRKRMRRQIPEPDVLLERFDQVVEVYEAVKDSVTGEALLQSAKVQALIKNIRAHIKRGCLSDIPGVAYYIRIGKDKDGLPIYRCMRGTSALEGFHRKMVKLLTGYTNDPLLALQLLSELCNRNNIRTSVKLGQLSSRYNDFYDHEIYEEDMLRCPFVNPYDDLCPTFRLMDLSLKKDGNVEAGAMPAVWYFSEEEEDGRPATAAELDGVDTGNGNGAVISAAPDGDAINGMDVEELPQRPVWRNEEKALYESMFMACVCLPHLLRALSARAAHSPHFAYVRVQLPDQHQRLHRFEHAQHGQNWPQLLQVRPGLE